MGNIPKFKLMWPKTTFRSRKVMSMLAVLRKLSYQLWKHKDNKNQGERTLKLKFNTKTKTKI